MTGTLPGIPANKLAGVFGGNLTELFVRKDMDFLATWMNSKGVNSAWIGLTTNAKGHWDDRTTVVVLGKPW